MTTPKKMGININTGLYSAREDIGVSEELMTKTKNPIKKGFVFSRNLFITQIFSDVLLICKHYVQLIKGCCLEFPFKREVRPQGFEPRTF